MAGRTPVIIPVSELRRNMSKLIRQVERSHVPLFITQRGHVSAVALSRDDFGTMCVLRDKGIQAISPRMHADDRLPGGER